MATDSNRGVCTSVVQSLVNWSFNELGLHRLLLCHAITNEASCRVAVKAGFAYEGTLISAQRLVDSWHDMHLHAQINSSQPPQTATASKTLNANGLLRLNTD
jgi:RimJ/RimL family protein N-acetyltransferase